MLNINCIRDNKASTFLTPFCSTSTADAMRSLDQAVNDPKKTSQLSMYPSDFDLYLLGKFDQEKGLIIPATTPEFVVGASSFVKLTEVKSDNTL